MYSVKKVCMFIEKSAFNKTDNAWLSTLGFNYKWGWKKIAQQTAISRNMFLPRQWNGERKGKTQLAAVEFQNLSLKSRSTHVLVSMEEFWVKIVLFIPRVTRWVSCGEQQAAAKLDPKRQRTVNRFRLVGTSGFCREGKRSCILRYNALYSGESQLTFRRNMSPTSGLKSKPSKKQAHCLLPASCWSLPPSSRIKMKGKCSSETSVDFNLTARLYNQGDGHRYNRRY
jgi:hypothetical protein